MYKGIIFDLDGTLIDSAQIVADVLNRMRHQKGKDALGIEWYRSWSSEGGEVLVGNALDLPLKDAIQLVPEFRKNYFDLPTPIESIYPGVIDMLREFKSRNIRMAICSNKPENLCRKVLKETPLCDFFEVVIGGDTLSKKKPDPEPLIYSVKKILLHINKVLYVGDSSIDKNTAMAANIDFAHFMGGYDSSLSLDSNDIAFKAHNLLVLDLISREKISE